MNGHSKEDSNDKKNENDTSGLVIGGIIVAVASLIASGVAILFGRFCRGKSQSYDKKMKVEDLSSDSE